MFTAKHLVSGVQGFAIFDNAEQGHSSPNVDHSDQFMPGILGQLAGTEFGRPLGVGEHDIGSIASTPEALEPLFEKRMDGFSEVFHRISYDKIGTSTIQSRATGGVANATFIFVLPGSPGACKDAWDGIIKLQLDYRHMPCNFVEIMPRLDEHLRREKAKGATA